MADLPDLGVDWPDLAAPDAIAEDVTPSLPAAPSPSAPGQAQATPRPPAISAAAAERHYRVKKFKWLVHWKPGVDVVEAGFRFLAPAILIR